ncbi:MAG: type IV secretory system conjugative DNA transfer family protein [Cystobacterineae bacterium]|nr:type IV secretory system conjugative DNA transfer family protein [Cystobacterineae bacterium]
MKMYRLRSTTKLLGKNENHPELAEKIIFFIPASNFNDPLEGRVEMIYHGDSIVWENLFKHFLLCMEHKVALATLLKPEESENFFNSNFPIFCSETNLSTDLSRQIFSTIKERFFSYDDVKAWIQYLGSRRTPICEEQLLSIFNFITNIALESVLFGYDKAGLQPQTEFLVALQEKLSSKPYREIFELMSIVGEDQFDIAMEVSSRITQETNLIEYCKLGEKAKLINWGYFMSDYPSEYIANLQKLVYPDWYAASFMGKFPKYTDLWSHYADSHKGVCLIYNAEQKDEHSNPYIEIERPTGYNTSTGITMGYAPAFFEKVNYEDETIQVDFFKCFLNQPAAIIIDEWYTNAAGQRSSLISETSPLISGTNLSEEDLREYWDRFLTICTTKTKDWEKENEYRLRLNDSFFFDFFEPKSRTLHYKFNSLIGIVFGIKTSIEDKAKIIKIIDSKCKEGGRKDFAFYQARYDKKQNEVVYDELSLLKFQ